MSRHNVVLVAEIAVADRMTPLRFTFPPPGSLMGVRSQTRAIMKLTNCTFTYDGAAKPSLIDVSCALTLSSRVGILGPNGAGKSTLIKLLTVSLRL